MPLETISRGETIELLFRKREFPSYRARVSCGSLQFEGLVRNLTAGGAMFECEYPFAKGAAVTLHIEGMGQMAGTVAWSIDGRAGVKFDTPRS